MDGFFNALDKRDLARGSLTISRNGRIVYRRALGYASMDSTEKIRTTTNTTYRIGSATKMFTAVMIFQLLEEGTIRLDQTLNLFSPQLPHANRITIGNLLQHRSGLHNYTEGTNFQEWMGLPGTQERLLEIIKGKGSDFEPNARAAYSTTNYLLLGYIIEKICGMSYEMALARRITSKAGLAYTYIGRRIDARKNESAYYKYMNNEWKAEKETDLSIRGGAGVIVATPGDLIKFIEALFNLRLVRESGLNTMKTLVDDYGMGLFPFPHGARTAFGHNGKIEEFYSPVRYFPDDKMAVAYITNGIIYPGTDIIEAVLKICFEEPFTVPFSKPVSLRSKDLDKYTGTYSSGEKPKQPDGRSLQ